MSNKAVSPVIGVILMVAVTVAFVGLATFIVLNISDGTSNSQVPDSSIKSTKTSDGLQTTVLKDSNVKEFVVQGPDGKQTSLNSDTGSVETIGDGAGQYEIISIANDGSAQVVTTTDVNKNTTAANARTATFTQTGTVSINPPIEDAIVKSVEDGIVVDTTRTDSNGGYSLGASKDSDIIVVVNGFDDSQITGTLYASAKENSDDGDSVDFNFDEDSSNNININGNNLLISYYKDSPVKEIGTPEQLQAIDKISNGLSSDYELVDNVNSSDTSNFDSIGTRSNPFIGTLDGNNNTIKDMKIKNETKNENVSFISELDGSILKNIEFKNIKLEGNASIGLIGNKKGSTQLSNVDINNMTIKSTSEGGYNTDPLGTLISTNNGDEDIENIDVKNVRIESGKNGDVGGVIGTSKSNGFHINNSSVRNLKIESSAGDSMGGFIGFIQASNNNIVNSSSSVNIEGDDIGGFIGQIYWKGYANITNSEINMDSINPNGSIGGNIGGAVGDGRTNITNLTANIESVAGDIRVGGLIGQALFGNITNSNVNIGIVKGTDSSSGDNLGGLVGEGDVNIKNTTVDIRTIKGDDDVGGLIGDGDGNITYSNVEIETIDPKGDHVGGLVGSGGGDISGTNVNISVIKGLDYTGGFGGLFRGNISDSNYKGHKITGKNRVGGLVGQLNDGNIDNSSANIDNILSSGNNVGGIIGRTVKYDDDGRSYVNNSYVTSDKIEGMNTVGGIVGLNGFKIQNSYSSSNVAATDGNIVGSLVGKNGRDVEWSSWTGTSMGGSDGIIENSYWDTTLTNKDVIGVRGGNDTVDDSDNTISGGDSITNGEILGLKNSEMQGSSAKTNMDALDFDNNWTTVSGDYPELQD